MNINIDDILKYELKNLYEYHLFLSFKNEHPYFYGFDYDNNYGINDASNYGWNNLEDEINNYKKHAKTHRIIDSAAQRYLQTVKEDKNEMIWRQEAKEKYGINYDKDFILSHIDFSSYDDLLQIILIYPIHFYKYVKNNHYNKRSECIYYSTGLFDFKKILIKGNNSVLKQVYHLNLFNTNLFIINEDTGTKEEVENFFELKLIGKNNYKYYKKFDSEIGIPSKIINSILYIETDK